MSRFDDGAGLSSITVLKQFERRRVCGAIGPAEDVVAERFRVRPAEEFARSGFDRPRPERGGHAVIVGLPDRVELVVVATGALYGQSQERGRRGANHVLEAVVLVLVRVVRLVIPGAEAYEAGGDDGLLISPRHLVAGELLNH